jgi:translation initiation factor 3 subunit E
MQVPESLTKRRSEVVSKLKALESQVKPITEFLSNEDHVKLLKQDKTQNMAFLQKEFGIGEVPQGGSENGAARAGGGRADAPLISPPLTFPPPSSHPHPPAGPDQVDALYHYAKWNFECGNYSAASEYLYHYRALSTHPERSVSALWGKVAADILLQVGAGSCSKGRGPCLSLLSQPATPGVPPLLRLQP